MNFEINETVVKENFHLARESTTVFTQIASDLNVVLPLEYVCKGISKCPTKLSPPKGVMNK